MDDLVALGSMIDDCNCTLLQKAGRKVGIMYDRSLSAVGLTSGQFAILRHLKRFGKAGATVGSLARALVMDRTSLSHSMRPLERDGLVLSSGNPADRRLRIISLTIAGLQKFELAKAEWTKAQIKFNASVGIEQAYALRLALEQVAQASLGDQT